MNDVIKICLTGGPCGGKTSALPLLSRWLTDQGYHVVTVPEMATLLFSNGIFIADLGTEQMDRIQTELLGAMLRLEGAFEESARAMDASWAKATILLCDRGAMDISSFTSPESWCRIRKGHTDEALKDRYDAVFHLVTTADGAAHSYTQDIAGTGVQRAEAAERAAEVDRLTKAAWVGHEHLRVIPNRGTWDTKMNDLKAAITRFLEPVEVERRFLVKSIKWPEDLKRAESEIWQIYLQDGSRLRYRNGRYTLTDKSALWEGLIRTEHEREITPELAMKAEQLYADSTRQPIRKCRTTFLHDDQYFELDQFHHDELDDPRILEIELDRNDQEVRLPSWIEVIKEVTDDPAYSNKQLALVVK